MNTELRKAGKNDLEKDFFKLINNSFFGKTKLSHYKIFHRKFVSYRNERNLNTHNEPLYLELQILELSKTLLHGFWYDYVETKYREKEKLCYMDTYSVIWIHIALMYS